MPLRISFHGSDNDVCINCGARDEFGIDYVHGTEVCHSCGFCVTNFETAVAKSDSFNGKSNARESAVPKVSAGASRFKGTSYPKRRKSAPNDRRTYFAERIRQWQQREKPIPDDDWDIIATKFLDFCFTHEDARIRNIAVRLPTPSELRQSKGKQLRNTYCPTKEDIRHILVACDAIDEDADEWEMTKTVEKRAFRKKYLEKWITIRWRVCGVTTTADQCPPWVLERLIDMRNQLEQAFVHGVDRSKRKSFPSVNFVVRRCFDMLGTPHLRKEFLLPKTRRSRKKNTILWRQMIKWLQWPYINSDA